MGLYTLNLNTFCQIQLFQETIKIVQIEKKPFGGFSLDIVKKTLLLKQKLLEFFLSNYR